MPLNGFRHSTLSGTNQACLKKQWGGVISRLDRGYLDLREQGSVLCLGLFTPQANEGSATISFRTSMNKRTVKQSRILCFGVHTLSCASQTIFIPFFKLESQGNLEPTIWFWVIVINGCLCTVSLIFYFRTSPMLTTHSSVAPGCRYNLVDRRNKISSTRCLPRFSVSA